MGEAASPLGRYADAPDASEGVVEVRLLAVPVALHAAAREHHDALMREFRLLALSDQLPSEASPARLVELTKVLGVRYAAARARPDAAVDAALDRGDATVDLTFSVPPSVAAVAQQLEELLSEADEFCRQEQLMTLPRPPLLMAFVRWYLDQFVDQIAGRPPVPWDGPLDGV